MSITWIIILSILIIVLSVMTIAYLAWAISAFYRYGYSSGTALSTNEAKAAFIVGIIAIAIVVITIIISIFLIFFGYWHGRSGKTIAGIPVVENNCCIPDNIPNNGKVTVQSKTVTTAKTTDNLFREQQSLLQEEKSLDKRQLELDKEREKLSKERRILASNTLESILNPQPTRSIF